MVAQNTVRTYGVIQTFRFAEGIKRVVNFDFFSVLTYLTAYVRNMFWATNLYKYNNAYNYWLLYVHLNNLE